MVIVLPPSALCEHSILVASAFTYEVTPVDFSTLTCTPKSITFHRRYRRVGLWLAKKPLRYADSQSASAGDSAVFDMDTHTGDDTLLGSGEWSGADLRGEKSHDEGSNPENGSTSKSLLDCSNPTSIMPSLPNGSSQTTAIQLP
jgi:hypothetical protein